jgi:hypothetical protein
MTEEFNPPEIKIDQQVYNSFITRLKEKENSELDKIITRYISYQPELVEAALYVAVDRGLISYDLKENMTGQIRTNFSSKVKGVKKVIYEQNNAFTGYVERFRDEDIYSLIEDPSEIVIDVYHAVLSIAKKRELISEADFIRLYGDGLKASRNEEEIMRDEYNEIILGDEDVEITDAEPEAEKEKYWKCPACNELVSVDLAVCWNCEASIPDKIEHPEKEEVIREVKARKSYDPVKTGMSLAGAGVIIILLTFSRGHSITDYWHFRYLTLLLGVISLLFGLGIIIYKKVIRPGD